VTGTVTFLFTDIEGSTQLWEQEPEQMRPALARHDALIRAAVVSNRGTVVKMTGDGVYAAFDEPTAALDAAVAIQRGLADPVATTGLALRIRCGLHLGEVEWRDDALARRHRDAAVIAYASGRWTFERPSSIAHPPHDDRHSA